MVQREDDGTSIPVLEEVVREWRSYWIESFTTIPSLAVRGTGSQDLGLCSHCIPEGYCSVDTKTYLLCGRPWEVEWRIYLPRPDLCPHPLVSLRISSFPFLGAGPLAPASLVSCVLVYNTCPSRS